MFFELILILFAATIILIFFSFKKENGIESFIMQIIKKQTCSVGDFIDSFKDINQDNFIKKALCYKSTDIERYSVCKSFSDGIVNLCYRYSSIVIDLNYCPLKNINVANRYNKFINFIESSISKVSLIDERSKSFGKQYLHCFSINNNKYSIVYNRHECDANYIKIIVLLV